MYRHPRPTIVLASSSPYRRALLDRLRLDFRAVSPEVDESPQPGEDPEALALRLAEAKALALAPAFPDALLIGSDQVAVLGTRILGKPGSHEAAVAQLLASSGRTLRFLTALCLLDAASGHLQRELVPTTVTLRPLERPVIEAYLRREQPYGCAGAFMAEGLGIALMEKVVSDDPSALIGLPLIALARMLRQEGVEVLLD